MDISNIIIWKFGSGTCDFMVRGGELIWEDKNINRPTDSELKLWELDYKIAYSLQEFRKQRNQLLAETDWMGNYDLIMSDAWKTYRQALRDITSGLDTVDKVNAVTWPTKPE